MTGHQPLDDDFYERLMSLHDGLSDEQSARLNARLVLLMANHIGMGETMDQLLEKAQEDQP
ncbi:MAG: DUF2783 domain-containing protein [Hyphomicrobiales bacterium]